MRYTQALYGRLGLARVYYSAWQNPQTMIDDTPLFGITRPPAAGPDRAAQHDHLLREHRLYQTDFLLRRYGFSFDDFSFDDRGNLDLTCDPKQAWADRHPEFFPVNINRASRRDLLRVPGLGPVTVKRILALRKTAALGSMTSLGPAGKRLTRAGRYLRFD